MTQSRNVERMRDFLKSKGVRTTRPDIDRTLKFLKPNGDTTPECRTDARLFETGWRSYDITSRHRSDAGIFDGVRTTLRRNVKRKLDISIDLDWPLERSKPDGDVERTLDFPKPESVCTTRRRDVDRMLDFSKPDDVQTTLRCVTERTLYYWKLNGRRSISMASVRHQAATLNRARLFETRRRPYDTTLRRSTFQNPTATVRHYNALLSSRL